MNCSKTLKTLAALISATSLAGCIGSPLPSGSEAQLYRWQQLDAPLVARSGIESTDYNGYFDGDFDFSGIAAGLSVGQADMNAPYLLKSCADQACYYAVLYPADFDWRDDGLIGGFAALTPLSTAMYGDVKDLPAEQVRPRLDALAAAVTTTDGPRDYAGFIKLDYQRAPADQARVARLEESANADAAIQAGELPSLQALLDGAITSTGDLQAPTDFVFSSAWDLAVDVNVSGRMEGAYLALCAEFKATGAEHYWVNYANCRLKTPLAEGSFQDSLRMSASVDSLLAVLIPLANPTAREYHLWQRAEDGDSFEVR